MLKNFPFGIGIFKITMPDEREGKVMEVELSDGIILYDECLTKQL